MAHFKRGFCLLILFSSLALFAFGCGGGGGGGGELSDQSTPDETHLIGKILLPGADDVYITKGESITFSAFHDGQKDAEYMWELDGAEPSSAEGYNTSPVTFLNEGTFTVKLTVIKGNGSLTDTLTVHVTESSALSANILSPSGSVSINKSESISFYGVATGGTQPYQFEWDFGDGTRSSEQNPTRIFDSEGQFTIELKVTDSNGAQATESIQVIVNEVITDTEPLASITSPAGNITINSEDSVVFNGVVTSGDAPFTYHWSFGDGTEANTPNPGSHAYTNLSNSLKTFTVTFIVTDNDGDTDSKSLTVTVRPQTVIEKGPWKHISASYDHSIAVRKDGTLWAWGQGMDYCLGTGTTSDQLIPACINTEKTWVMAAAGHSHGLALKSDGTLWSWGCNLNWQTGQSLPPGAYYVLIPAQVGTDNDWSYVIAGDSYSFALKKDGSLWAAGLNTSGIFGIGDDISEYKVFTKISDGPFKKIVAGYAHLLALKTDGSLWASGYNNYGEIGDGTKTNVNTLKRIAPDLLFKDISASAYSSMAITTTGNLYGWGWNYYGEIALGTTVKMATYPTCVGTDSDWTCVFGGFDGRSAGGLKSSGNLYVWGRHQHGQLGITDSTGSKYTPYEHSLKKVTIASFSHGNGFFINSDGILYGSGEQDNGALGNGKSGDYIWDLIEIK
jgi:alpha-tubulin suppressor-like RCC1 family protein